LHSASPYQNKNYQKKRPKLPPTLFFSTKKATSFGGEKICKKLDRRNSQDGTSNFCTAGGTPGQVVGCMVLEKKHISPKI